MIPNDIHETLQKAVDNAIEEIMASYQRAWSTPSHIIEKNMKNDAELIELFKAQEYLSRNKNKTYLEDLEAIRKHKT